MHPERPEPAGHVADPYPLSLYLSVFRPRGWGSDARTQDFTNLCPWGGLAMVLRLSLLFTLFSTLFLAGAASADPERDPIPGHPTPGLDGEVGEIPPYEEVDPDETAEGPHPHEAEPERFPAFTVRFDYWFARIGSFRFQKQKGQVGKIFRPTSDLGLRGPESSGGPRITLDFAIDDWVGVRYRWFEQTYRDHRQELQKQIDLDGTTFTQGTFVSTKFRFDDHDLAVTFYPVRNRYVRLGIPLGVKYATGLLRLRTPDLVPVVRARQRISSAIPYAGVELGLGIRPVEIYGRIAGMGYSGGDNRDNHAAGFFEGEAGVALHLGRHLEITGGWFFYSLDIEKEREFDNQEMDFNLSGAFAGIALRF